MNTSRSRKGYKVVSPLRFFTFVTMVMLVCVMLVYSFTAMPTEAASSTCTYKQVTVKSNDNLWSLAEEFGLDDMDSRIIVKEICDTNDIEAGDIHSGDKIFIPVDMQ